MHTFIFLPCSQQLKLKLQVQNGLLNLIKLKLATDPEFTTGVWTTNALTGFWTAGTVSFAYFKNGFFEWISLNLGKSFI